MEITEHERAAGRLDLALVDQALQSGRLEVAMGTSGEFHARLRLQYAAQEVAAREAWMSWIDDDGFRGLNAGPFELLGEDHLA